MNFQVNMDIWIFGINVNITLTPGMAVILAIVAVVVLWQTITTLF